MKPYFDGEDELPSRTTSFQEGEDDEDINTIVTHPTATYTRPITKARARQLNYQRDEHWSNTKHGDDGMHKGNKNGVTSDNSRTLKPP